MRLRRGEIGGIVLATVAVSIVAYFMVKYFQRVAALHDYQENVPGETFAIELFGMLAVCSPVALVCFFVGRWLFSD